jgi:hypothetical protein
MIISVTTKNYGLEIFVKLLWLGVVLIFAGYNLLMRSLDKKFGDQKSH